MGGRMALAAVRQDASSGSNLHGGDQEDRAR